MDRFKKVAKTSDIPVGMGLSVRFKEERVAVFNVDGKFFAMDDACPHRGAPLGDGPLTGSVVTCTWHGWEFDVLSGCHVADPNLKLRRYATKIKGNDLYVSLDPIEELDT